MTRYRQQISNLQTIQGFVKNKKRRGTEMKRKKIWLVNGRRSCYYADKKKNKNLKGKMI